MNTNGRESLTVGSLQSDRLWIMGMRGVIAVVFGIALLIWPEAALLAFVSLFGVFAASCGILLIFTAIRARNLDVFWWLLLIEGIISVGIGCVALFRPVTTGIAMLFLLGIWSIATGIFQIIAAIRLRNVIVNERLAAAAGVVSILCGTLLTLWPFAGAVAIVWLVGIYAIFLGTLLIALTCKLRNWHRDQKRIYSKSDSSKSAVF